MSGLKIPLGQKRLTNIAIVRLKSHGKRFEIACFKNKVLNWREGIEKDINEVIQTDTIYENVTKGKVAREQDLKSVFGTTDLEEICRKILKSGELQVSDKEREVHLEGVFRDIVQIVVERTVHPQTCRHLTPHTVENALKSIGFSVKPDHAAKKQALEAIKSLCEKLPDSFARAKMRLRITCPAELLGTIKDHLTGEHGAQLEEDSTSNETNMCAVTFACDPSHYRQLDALATVTYARQGVTLQIIAATVLNESVDILSNVQTTVTAGVTANATSGYPQAHQQSASVAPGTIVKPKGMKCSNCEASFEDAAEYRAHCKSEWHNFNLKRKVKNMPRVSEEEFKEISLDAREGFIGVE
jgi:ribosome maturation protein SDO1